MSLRKKLLVYSDGVGKVYRFKKMYDSNFCCLPGKMSKDGRCDQPLIYPIKANTTIYFTINALCREINGRVNKKFIVV